MTWKAGVPTEGAQSQALPQQTTVCSATLLYPNKTTKQKEETTPIEITGLFAALEEDIYEYVGRHITLLDWLRERDYRGIRYDANNDYR